MRGQFTPPGKREPAAPIIRKLPEATLEGSRDKTAPKVAKKIAVTERADTLR